VKFPNHLPNLIGDYMNYIENDVKRRILLVVCFPLLFIVSVIDFIINEWWLIKEFFSDFVDQMCLFWCRIKNGWIGR
jgi:hypothetical protein